MIPLLDLPLDASNIQLKFELRGAGTLWVDDIRTQLVSRPKGRTRQNEYNELINRRAFALRQLKENRLAECYRTLDSYWPKFLTTYVPQSEPRLAEVPKVRTEPKKPAKSTFEQMRGVLPQWPKVLGGDR